MDIRKVIALPHPYFGDAVGPPKNMQLASEMPWV